MTKKSAQKIALDLYMSHTQRADQAIQQLPEVHWENRVYRTSSNSAQVSSVFGAFFVKRKCEIMNVKWFKHKPTGDDFYCVF